MLGEIDIELSGNHESLVAFMDFLNKVSANLGVFFEVDWNPDYFACGEYWEQKATIEFDLNTVSSEYLSVSVKLPHGVHPSSPDWSYD